MLSQSKLRYVVPVVALVWMMYCSTRFLRALERIGDGIHRLARAQETG